MFVLIEPYYYAIINVIIKKKNIVTLPNNPLPFTPPEITINLISLIPPLELSTITELYFFIKEREETYFQETLSQLLFYKEAETLWFILDFLWLSDKDREWTKPLMIKYLQQKIYLAEEFDI